MSCHDHTVIIDLWNPQGPDLPDATAVHLDACPGCRQRFDARFEPVTRARVERGPRRTLAPLWAAAALLVVFALPTTGPSETSVAADFGECADEIWFEPVCPPV